MKADIQQTRVTAPSYDAVIRAEEVNAEAGHENLGFLSFSHGFMPKEPPLLRLPEKFSAWDELAADLPRHYMNQSLRQAFQALPVLIPDEESLPEPFLCRASVLMSMFAHAYVRCEREEDLNIPAAIQQPWELITSRLKRPVPFLSYIDLIVYNWKLQQPEGPVEVENLLLLVPTVDNNEERIFYLTQTEILAKAAPVISAVTDVQNAILMEDTPLVIAGLQRIQETIEALTEKSFLKINPNPRSSTYVDPIVWAKTVAPFAVPLKEGVQGPSGTSSPIFHLIDTFIERARYDTILGEEALFIRRWYPEHWRNFLSAVEQVSLSAYVEKAGSDELHGAYYSLVESYAGRQGFLGVHKRKVYGYLQMAFKVGRSVTIGGFSGLFKERTWEEVDDELESTRLERYADKSLKCPFATISGRRPAGSLDVQNIQLDIRDKGVSYRPGDRVAILPSNNEQEVAQLLQLLQLPPELPVKINERWREHAAKYFHVFNDELPLKRILQSAQLHRVYPSKLAEPPAALHACLQGIQRANIHIGLKDFIDIVTGHGIGTDIFASGHFLTDLLEVEKERLYSISSGDLADKKGVLELTVGKVKAQRNGKPAAGVASGYLHDAPVSADNRIPFRIVRPLRFKLPEHPDRPVIMFAGGTGISPFKAFWEHLSAGNRAHKGWLFLSIREQKDLPYREELEELVFEKGFRVDVAVTREPVRFNKTLSHLGKQFVFEPAQPARIGQLLADESYQERLYEYLKSEHRGGKQANIYVCGKAGFAKSVMDALRRIIKIQAEKEGADARELFYELFSADRYMQDIFTDQEPAGQQPTHYHISDVIKRNNDQYGYWVIVNNKIFDLTEFKEIHPGGEKIVLDNAGRDGTHEFRRAEHHHNPEIMSLLSMYYVGEVIVPQFESAEIAVKYHRWLSAVHLSTEMQNTLYTDYTFTGKQTTRADHSGSPTAYKRSLILENHLRFNEEYIPLLTESLLEQYTTDTPLTAALAEISARSRQEAAFIEGVFEAYQHTADAALLQVLQEIEQADKALILDIRRLFRAGLKYFEGYETELHQLFDQNLQTILQHTVDKLRQYNNATSSRNGRFRFF
ncbi:hypothetical protein ECE50_010740 [Chitinophaga sp. Mgbs1]|uniref:Cytochrome b5 heme-binding domain-containing protein n=1 Tax=Chitinophaga solisilvae TaxID=1233460 RepID=A0A9Q5D3F4_9BACT|nr:hypothetical protein [Chitinophaga solisilvae]